ncbi:chromosomal replication initiation ATPase DnaA [Rhodovulum iodosum]|uniref:Chromosomal replication initiation ATPase DnaA n=1 Tax=Rhodovulum iodosum TaxID=68291 RepID=A0ABV3XPL3_9RHOB|nr:DnaA/Hda family protein [Rhodovulum robiginosum]RSK31447.1 chromosomal replication initiator DnaA [Rhodovulum robiginosum]
MARQLTFDLPVRPARGREAFFVTPANQTALAQVEDWRDWPQGKLVLVGPEGSGKTHLTHVWAAQSGARVVAAGALAGTGLPELAAEGAVAVEDADRAAGDAAAERALFHLHNLLLAEGGALLVTARHAPRDWPLTLPDLKSRMEATATAHLQGPDDALLAALLVKLFADRQLAVDPGLVAYLVDRMDRSFAAAQALVEALDHEALATGRKPGIRLAAEVLDKAQGPAP